MQQYQQDNALISTLFIVHAPLAVASQLNFRESLPMHAVQNGRVASTCEECVDNDVLPFHM